MKTESLKNILDRLANNGSAVFSKNQLYDVIEFVQDCFYYKWSLAGGGNWSVYFEITGIVE